MSAKTASVQPAVANTVAATLPPTQEEYIARLKMPKGIPRQLR
ncbi:hypothetical protein AKJ09_08417 [Labilithrix luteola]|uniref:Uncharacterized protein n=1 Tax=Labilithrix luteola TaxID=1391654 RepID=A0A0K1Q7R5_9BACT|nr:hypothetical protein AKJ09_08417 [Labilithrix luteola]